MARTFRNRHTVAKGWEVRDNGKPYYKNSPWGRAFTGSGKEFQDFWAIPRYRRSLYRCENGWARHKYNQTYRTKTNHLLRTGRWEDILPPTGTGGWLSW